MEKQKRYLVLKPEYLVKKKFLESQNKIINLKTYHFRKELINGKIKYINVIREKAKQSRTNNDSIHIIKKMNVPLAKSSDVLEQKKNKLLNYFKDYYKTCILPVNFQIKQSDNIISKIKIRKTKKSLEIATNPIIIEDGKTIKYCLGTISLEEIHPQKFIMLNNSVCYDIELLINYVVGRYQNDENYNIEPEYQIDPIWTNKTDINKILSHTLIKNPEKLQAKYYLYGKKTYIENVKILKEIIHESNINKPYFDLFDKYPQFLINMNRLGTLFHIEQPTSFFDLDSIEFKEIDGISDENVTIITDRLTSILKSNYIEQITEMKDINHLITTIKEIITEIEYAYFTQLIENLNIILSENQLEQIIKNIAQMMAFYTNFNEGSQGKIKFINYINEMDKKNNILALGLVNSILTSDDCIHRQGNKLRYVFLKWWYKYWNYYGFTDMEISSKLVPITYSSILNKKCIISSSLLEKYHESTHGYIPIICPYKKYPSMYYKMGNIDKWDGINLNTFGFCCRLSNDPYL